MRSLEGNRIRVSGVTGVAALTLAGGFAAPVEAQEAAREAPPGLSVERIFATDELEAETIPLQWMRDGEHWTVVEADSLGRDELWRVRARDGERRKLIAAAELAPPGREASLVIESHAFSEDDSRVLLFTDAQKVWRDETKGRYWVFDFDARRLTPVSERPGWQMFAKLSPQGDRVAFVRDHDLWLVDLETGVERRLTTDGSETIINGTTDWVYEEELGLRDAFRWSPDGSRIAYWRLDQSPIPVFHLVDLSPLYPELIPIRYPKAGASNSRVRVGSLELATGVTTWFDLGGDEDVYVARMEWAASPEEVTIQRLNRRQNRIDVLMGDARTGATRLLFSEEDERWVDVDDDLRWVGDGQRFTWSSDRDGWNHLYLYARDGRLLRQLTRGEWDVTDFHGVDAAGTRAWFTAARPSPLVRSVYSVALEGDADPVLLAGGRGTHEPEFAPDFSLWVDEFSSIGTPPETTLRAADGGALRTLEDNAELRRRVEALDIREPEFLVLSAADGTDLDAWIIKPRDFDPGLAYPLLLYVYGGPGSQTVRDVWGGDRYLWHQLLVERGILVASVDNRGTGARGRAFEKQVYMRLGQLETADQLAAARELGALPYVDEERIGIWGWSYGGYMTLMATLLGEGALAAGISVAPVTAWELYDTIYTERYMRKPSENPEGYREGAPLSHADRLDASLLIVHGTGDDNVHAQNTIRMVAALEEAGKQFRMRLYPNKTHSISGGATRVNLYGLMTEFLEAELGAGAVAPEGAPASAGLRH